MFADFCLVYLTENMLYRSIMSVLCEVISHQKLFQHLYVLAQSNRFLCRCTCSTYYNFHLACACVPALQVWKTDCLILYYLNSVNLTFGASEFVCLGIEKTMTATAIETTKAAPSVTFQSNDQNGRVRYKQESCLFNIDPS
jgi:hypothetical protein